MITIPAPRLKALRLFRRVVVWDEAGQREIVLLTNNLKLAASTIGAIYTSRWHDRTLFQGPQTEPQDQDLRVA